MGLRLSRVPRDPAAEQGLIEVQRYIPHSKSSRPATRGGSFRLGDQAALDRLGE
jgi:hypothetical protein